MRTNKRKFYVGDVLNVVLGRLVSPRGINGSFEILKFMTGKSLSELPRVSRECRESLLRQFPQFEPASPGMIEAVRELEEMLKKVPSGEAETNKILRSWISNITSGTYGLKLPLCGRRGMCGDWGDMLEVAKIDK